MHQSILISKAKKEEGREIL